MALKHTDKKLTYQQIFISNFLTQNDNEITFLTVGPNFIITIKFLRICKNEKIILKATL